MIFGVQKPLNKIDGLLKEGIDRFLKEEKEGKQGINKLFIESKLKFFNQ
jgi:hypothetical protein